MKKIYLLTLLLPFLILLASCSSSDLGTVDKKEVDDDFTKNLKAYNKMMKEVSAYKNKDISECTNDTLKKYCIESANDPCYISYNIAHQIATFENFYNSYLIGQYTNKFNIAYDDSDYLGSFVKNSTTALTSLKDNQQINLRNSNQDIAKASLGIGFLSSIVDSSIASSNANLIKPKLVKAIKMRNENKKLNYKYREMNKRNPSCHKGNASYSVTKNDEKYKFTQIKPIDK